MEILKSFNQKELEIIGEILGYEYNPYERTIYSCSHLELSIRQDIEDFLELDDHERQNWNFLGSVSELCFALSRLKKETENYLSLRGNLDRMRWEDQDTIDFFGKKETEEAIVRNRLLFSRSFCLLAERMVCDTAQALSPSLFYSSKLNDLGQIEIPKEMFAILNRKVNKVIEPRKLKTKYDMDILLDEASKIMGNYLRRARNHLDVLEIEKATWQEEQGNIGAAWESSVENIEESEIIQSFKEWLELLNAPSSFTSNETIFGRETHFDWPAMRYLQEKTLDVFQEETEDGNKGSSFNRQTQANLEFSRQKHTEAIAYLSAIIQSEEAKRLRQSNWQTRYRDNVGKASLIYDQIKFKIMAAYWQSLKTGFEFNFSFHSASARNLTLFCFGRTKQ